MAEKRAQTDKKNKFFTKNRPRKSFLKIAEPKLWNIWTINNEFPNKKLDLKFKKSFSLPIAANFWVLAPLVGFWLHLYGLGPLTAAIGKLKNFWNFKINFLFGNSLLIGRIFHSLVSDFCKNRLFRAIFWKKIWAQTDENRPKK